MSLNKALVPVDGSYVALKAAKYALLFAEKQGWEIVLLNVIEPASSAEFAGNAGIRIKANGSHQNDGKAVLLKAKEVFEDTDMPVITKLLEGLPSDVIVSEAESGNYEMIIMGSVGLGHGKFQSLFLGSVAEQVIRKVSIPVLLIKENTIV
jgi:nucleotide-binding universal stress UspA family protein